MKNKRILTVLVLLITVLLLGIGYALTNKTLQISGEAKATASDNNFIVRFKKTGDAYDAPTNLSNATATPSVTNDEYFKVTTTGLTTSGTSNRYSIDIFKNCTSLVRGKRI